MESLGVMKHIRELLKKGKSSREVIDMGYAPGTVYKILRQVRANGGITLPVNRALTRISNVPASLADTMSESDEDGGVLLHATPPMICPTCGHSSVHWIVCPHCSCLIPQDCGCPEDSPKLVDGYTLNEVLHVTTP